jgi:hypothetical protein
MKIAHKFLNFYKQTIKLPSLYWGTDTRNMGWRKHYYSFVWKCKFWFIWIFGFRGEDILEITRINNFLWWLCLLTDQEEMTNIYIGSIIDDSYQVLVHLFILVISKISSPLKPNIQMNQNLVGTTYGRFGIKFSQSRLKGERHRLSLLSNWITFFCKFYCRINTLLVYWQ